METARAHFPPVVYAPVTERPEEPGVQRLKMHLMADGRSAVMVYSALDRFVEMYDERAPWALVTVEQLQNAYDDAPYELLFLDRRLESRDEGSHS